MTRDRQVVGFDRTLDLTWMDATAGFVAEGLPTPEVRRRLFDYLEGVLPGTTPHTQRGKTITVLTRIWSRVPPDAVGLRDAALKEFVNALPNERLALHWAVAVAAYPFFLDTAATVGRLARLHGETSLQQITRRLEEGWGARPSIYRSAHRVLQTMERWGAVDSAEGSGLYTLVSRRKVGDAKCTTLLVEAILLGRRGGSVSAADLAGHPALFPFEITVDGRALRNAERLEVHRIGLDVDHVSLVGP